MLIEIQGVAMLSIVAVIPLYNGARWIERALWSAIKQTRPASEIVVVDDGSTDDGAGAELVKRVADQSVLIPVTLLKKPNGGQSSARNYGVAHSKGDLIALLDQDDVWYPRHLERLVEPFEKAGERTLPGWTYSDLDEIDESGAVIRSGWHRQIRDAHPKQTLKEYLERDCRILPSASLISRAAFEHVGGFDERLAGYEDDDLFTRLFQAGFQSAYIPEPSCQWRIHPGSSSCQPTMALSRATYAGKLLERFPEFSNVICTRFIRQLCDTCIQGLKAGDAKALDATLAYAKELLPHTKGMHTVSLNTLTFVAQHHWLQRPTGRHVTKVARWLSKR